MKYKKFKKKKIDAFTVFRILLIQIAPSFAPLYSALDSISGIFRKPGLMSEE